MDNLIQQIENAQYSEHRPRFMLILDPSHETMQITNDFIVGIYRTKFHHVMLGVYFSYATGCASVLKLALQRHLGHSNFILSEIV